MIVSRRVASAGEADLPLVAAIPDRWAAIWQWRRVVSADALPDPAATGPILTLVVLSDDAAPAPPWGAAGVAGPRPSGVGRWGFTPCPTGRLRHGAPEI